MAHYQSGTQTRRVKELTDVVGDPYVEIHPDLAREIGAIDGDWLRVSSRRGCALGVARLSDSIRADTLFMPFHWGGKSCANSLTINVLDPTSRMPEFKVCAAKIELAIENTEIS
jgi:assimilatory nitrate reductase catalytic subunit